ncbi:hypothetical protein L6V77_17300 [Myxococcota bacterium]|nr:hypothetical protein [Myxococcota bacterium]
MVTSLFVSLVALLAPAEVGDPAPLLRRGTELYKAGVYDKAAEAFDAAWRLAPTPTTALNLAQALEGAGRPAEALDWYGRVMESEASGPRHEAALAGRRHLQGHGFLAVTCGPPGAALTAGPQRGACPTFGVYLPAGTHPLSLRADGRAPYDGTVSIPGGTRVERTLDLRLVVAAPAPPPASEPAPAVAAAVQPAPAPVEPAPEPDPAVPAWVGYTVAGVGAAALIVGGLYYAKAADDAERADGRPDSRARDTLEDDFDRHRAVGYGGLGVGGALVLAGGGLLVFGGAF